MHVLMSPHKFVTGVEIEGQGICASLTVANIFLATLSNRRVLNAEHSARQMFAVDVMQNNIVVTVAYHAGFLKYNTISLRGSQR